MSKIENNYAFIDSQNLNLSIRQLGWQLDFGRFRKYLTDKYHVNQAYLFIGYVPGNEVLYARLQSQGYICIFKPTLELPDGKVKGNVDAELVLWSMVKYSEYDKALIVTGDGDFCCLVKHFIDKGKLESVLIPNRLKYSALLKRGAFKCYLRYMNDLQRKLEYK